MKAFSKHIFLELTPVILIFLLAMPRRLIFPLHGIFAFNYDQGRDFLAVSKIIETKHPVLIGQTTGLQGIFYGPWWYYFLSPIFYITKGDPHKIALIFAFLGILTIVAFYLLLNSITRNKFIAFSLATVTAFSGNWMLGSTNIWNPTLTPIFLTIFLYLIHKISANPKRLYFLGLGVISLLVADTTASFGAFLAIFILFSPLIFKKHLFLKNYLWTFAGSLIIILPRIVFEVRNHFLMTKSLIQYLKEPKIYAKHMTIFERITERGDQYFSIFSESFTRKETLLALTLLIVVSVVCIFIFKGKKTKKLIQKDFFVKYLFFLLLMSFLFFVIYPDNVWGYYLVGLPVLFLALLAKIFQFALNISYIKPVIYFLLPALFLFNLDKSLLPPYKADWQGDGGTYNNTKRVVDYIAEKTPKDYSLYSYSPAFFDYPVDYLKWWYGKKGIMENPKPNQRHYFLIIREASQKHYIRTGWYADKTKIPNILVERKIFNGDFLLEEHIDK